jgi:hypothetical protein
MVSVVRQPSTPHPRGTSKGGRTSRWKSDSRVVLGARESRAHGEAASRAVLAEGHMASTQREIGHDNKTEQGR